MNIAVLSDLHLGARNRLDRFGRGRAVESEFLEFLGEIEKLADTIVLLGDVFETLRGRWPSMHRTELESAMTAYPALTQRFLQDPRYRLIQGNHDLITGPVLGALEFLELRFGATKLLFFHGHQLSWFERGRAPLSRLGVWLGGWLERAGLGITQGLDWRRGHRDSPSERAASDFDHRAAAMGHARGADVVVTGHTHAAHRAELRDQLVLNSGTCVAGRREYLLIDTVAHEYSVVRGQLRSSGASGSGETNGTSGTSGTSGS